MEKVPPFRRFRRLSYSRFMPIEPRRRWVVPGVVVVMAVAAAAFLFLHHSAPPAARAAGARAVGARGAAMPADADASVLRLSGTVEAVRATTVIVPRLA